MGVCVSCVCAWRETTWQALYFSANADLSVCCWQSQTSPVPPPLSQTSNQDHFNPLLCSGRFLSPHSIPFPLRDPSLISAERKREREALCPHTPSETTLPPWEADLTMFILLSVDQSTLPFPHHANSDNNQHTKKNCHDFKRVNGNLLQ